MTLDALHPAALASPVGPCLSNPVLESPHSRCSETLLSLNQTLPALLQEAALIKPDESLAIHTLCVALTVQPCATNTTLLVTICPF